MASRVDDIEERDIGDHRRDEGMLDDVHVGDARELADQKGGRAHDRRGQLAVGGGGHLDRARFLGVGTRCASSSGMVKVPVVTVLAMEEPE